MALREMTEDGQEITIDDSERTPCEVWTRVMGYHRPVSAFNEGKKAEHRERQMFSEKSGGCQSMLAGADKPTLAAEPDPQPIPEPTVRVAVDPPVRCTFQRVDALSMAAA